MTEQTNAKAKAKANADDKSVQSRRAFLKGAGVAGVAGVAAAVSAVAGTNEAEAKSAEAPKSSGYRESDHVNAYYEAAKF